MCRFCFNPTHINVVEDGDIEGEPLPPLDRVGQSQLCKEVLADQQGSWLGHSEANLDEEKINVYCLLDSVDPIEILSSHLSVDTDCFRIPCGDGVRCSELPG